MTKVKSKKMKSPNAWVVSNSDKGRKKIKSNNKVYLDDGEEFEIELFNPSSENVLAIITLDGRLVSKTGILIRRGERMYLDSFIDYDMRKFKYVTYHVENADESIRENGILDVRFYNEDLDGLNDLTLRDLIYPYNIPNIAAPTVYPTYPQIWYSNNFDSGYNTNTSCEIDIETGQVTFGDVSESNQEYIDVDMNFESNYINSIRYTLLPTSRESKSSDDICKIIANKSSKSNDLYTLIDRVDAFYNLYLDSLLSKKELNTITDGVIISIIDYTKDMVIYDIDEFTDYIAKIGSLLKVDVISVKKFEAIKKNIFNAIKL